MALGAQLAAVISLSSSASGTGSGLRRRIARMDASTSKIGSVLDLSAAEHLALARYTRDAGNYVEMVLRPAGSVPLR